MIKRKVLTAINNIADLREEQNNHVLIQMKMDNICKTRVKSYKYRKICSRKSSNEAMKIFSRNLKKPFDTFMYILCFCISLCRFCSKN